MREIISIDGIAASPEYMDKQARFKYNSQKIANSLRKLKRKAASFLNVEDQRFLDEYYNNMKSYLADFEVFAQTKSLFDSRKREEQWKAKFKSLHIDKVTEKDLF